MLLASGGQSSGMPSRILQCTGQTPQGRTVWPQTSIAMKLRNPDMVNYCDKNPHSYNLRCSRGASKVQQGLEEGVITCLGDK